MTFTNSTDENNITATCKRAINIIKRQGHLCGIGDDEINEILEKSKSLLAPEPALLDISAPVVVFGDIHGQLSDLLKLLSLVGYPPETRILMLGDYVDRGKKCFEVMTYLLCYKILYPTRLFLLRGNHECAKMNRIYGFHEEMRRKRSTDLWRKFNDVFNELPLSAVISERILCMHGGISPGMTWETLRQLQKPKTPKECDDGLVQDLMWSDPTNDSCCDSGGFQYNKQRACSVLFNDASVGKVCSTLDLDFVCRAHELTPRGHLWQFNDRLLTLFSAPNYCGLDGNCGSVMHVGKDLNIWFTTLQPKFEKTSLTEKQQEELKKALATMEARSPDPNARSKS